MIDLEKLKNNLSFYAILTTGRTGSDYLHACLDKVPGILVFTGQVFIYNFFENLEKDFNTYTPEEILNLFIKKNKHLFYFDEIENKKVNLDLNIYKKRYLEIFKNNDFNKKNFLLSLYLAYHLMFNKL